MQWLAVPFAMTHPAMDGRSIATQPVQWLGHIEKKAAGSWIDSALLLIFGGIPWQV